MNHGWHRRLLRISQMSWDEIRTRSTQEIGKRLDAIAARFGHNFAPRELSSRHPADARFFFDSAEISARVLLLKKLLPDECTQIQREADAIGKHSFDLLGYSGLDYGREIDWHLDAVHGKRAPLKPWYKVHHLDFREVGDHKITWELNRHQHLVTLAKAWRLSGEERHLTELLSQWYSWQKANPYPLGINWASSLEVAFRSLSWIWVLRLIGDSDNVPKNFSADVQRGLALNGRHIEQYLSTYFSPNTHLLGEAVALFFLGTLFPQFEPAERWRGNGWRIILDAAQKQVRPDGVYFEQALHYHVYALDFFLHSRVLAARNGLSIPADFDAVIQKMLDVVEALSQAGPAEGFGDDDGGRVFNPRRNRTEFMTDSLAVGAALYKSKRIQSAAKVTEEAIWLLGEAAVHEAKPSADAARSKAFSAGGIYVLAGSKPLRQVMSLDAGPQGTGRCGHGHADALSLRLTMAGHRFLVDPGTAVYLSDTDDRNVFRGTVAHNTVRVDELDQAEPSGPFAWEHIPSVRTERWVAGEAFDYFVASHDGYQRLSDPVLHRRFVFRGPDGLWLVRDACEGRGRHLVESFWHFSEELQLGYESGAIVVGRRDSSPRLAILCARNSVFHAEMGSALVSPAYGRTAAAPAVRVSASVQVPAESGVLLVAQPAPAVVGKFEEVAAPGLRVFRYAREESVHTFIFSGHAGTWKFESSNSDAEFVYFRTEADRLFQFIMVRGSSASWQGKTLVSESSMLDKFEWSEGVRKYQKCAE